MEDLFREKSLKRISAPEQLDDYIKVTTPSKWLVLLSVVVLLVGLLLWCIFASEPAENGDGAVQIIDPISMIVN